MRWKSWLLALACAGCARAPEPVTLSGIAYASMPWQVKVAELPPGITYQTLQRELQGTLDEANLILSTYRPDSELTHLNAAPVGEWRVATPMLLDAVATAMRVSADSGGVYDVTVGPLVDLWGFGPKAVPTRTPTPDDIAAARSRVGWRHIGYDPQQRRLARLRNIQLDLSSLGEGAGVDALVKVLARHGVKDYLVSVAGTLRVRGHKAGGEGWRVAVERPDGSGLPERVLSLTPEDTTVSTSGAYRNYHEIDGVRYSHTLDPRTGKPITHKGVSVTVVMTGQPAAYADAWATALNALGPDEGQALAVRQGLAAYYLVKTGEGFAEQRTPAFQPFVRD